VKSGHDHVLWRQHKGFKGRQRTPYIFSSFFEAISRKTNLLIFQLIFSELFEGRQALEPAEYWNWELQAGIDTGRRRTTSRDVYDGDINAFVSS